MATLPPDRWNLIQARLDEALAMPAAERPSWLAALRSAEPALVHDLESLLQEHEAILQEGFLEQALPGVPAATDLAGQAFGAYTLVSPIGEGGMGTVWLAERADGRFTRRAAIKLPQVALLDRGAERFKREAQILGRLTHAHIAQLIDAGVSEAGRPYLVLEYVDGLPIDRYCEERRLGIDARLRLFLDVLQAVSHAHANLVVHRDIKPSNVLVTQDGEVKLLDFGVAKLLEDEGRAGEATLLTREFGTGLTLEYSAPEQVTGGAVSTAADVYSLGVLLFVLLTGQHPAGRGPHSHAYLVRAIVDLEAPRPSDVAPAPLRRALSGDVDTIVATALKKLPVERYASVAALADDLRRFLALEPIVARRDSFRYRAAKFVRRNRVPVTLAVAGAIAAVGGLAGTVIQARRASAERDFAVYQLARAEAINDLDNFLLTDAAPSGKPLKLGDLLARAEHLAERQHTAAASRVDLLVAIGRQYLQLDEEEAAGRVLKQAYDLSRRLAEPSARARAACALAGLLGSTKESGRAESLYREGMAALPDEPRFARDRMFCLQNGSSVARDRGAARDAIARAEAARTLLQSLPYESNVLRLHVLLDVAESYRAAGRQREAAATYSEAAAEMTAAGRDDTSWATTLFNDWGITLQFLGRPLESEAILRRGIDISRADGTDAGVSPMLMVNYARTLGELSRPEEAADWADRGRARAEQAGDQVIVNQSLLLLSSIYRQMHDVRRASAMLAAVEPKLREGLPPGHMAFASLRMQEALLASEAGDLGKALALADSAIDMTRAAITRTGQNADYLPIFLTRRASLRMDAGRAGAAESDTREAIRLFDASAESGTRSAYRGRAHLALGRALLASGKADEARKELQLGADHLRATLGPDHPDTRLAEQLIRAAR